MADELVYDRKNIVIHGNCYRAALQYDKPIVVTNSGEDYSNILKYLNVMPNYGFHSNGSPAFCMSMKLKDFYRTATNEVGFTFEKYDSNANTGTHINQFPGELGYTGSTWKTGWIEKSDNFMSRERELDIPFVGQGSPYSGVYAERNTIKSRFLQHLLPNIPDITTANWNTNQTYTHFNSEFYVYYHIYQGVGSGTNYVELTSGQLFHKPSEPTTTRWSGSAYSLFEDRKVSAQARDEDTPIFIAITMLAHCNCNQSNKEIVVWAGELTAQFPKRAPYIWRRFGTTSTDPAGAAIDPQLCDNKWHLVRPLYTKTASNQWVNVEDLVDASN